MNIVKRYGGFLLLGAAILGLLYTNLFVDAEEATPIATTTLTTSAGTTTSTSTETVFYVDLKGAVVRPGVYPAKPGTRLYEIVLLAGGFTADADSSSLNLAVSVYDAMVVMVPSCVSIPTGNEETIVVTLSGEVVMPGTYRITKSATLSDALKAAGGATIKADLSGFLLSGVLKDQMTIHVPTLGSNVTTVQEPASNNLIDINTASLDVLVTLPGIGDILGQRIIDYRAEFGPFDAIEDIMLVSGIKTSIYEQIKDRIRV